jgi:type IX secretion system PorP/SprF family membrane protein
MKPHFFTIIFSLVFLSASGQYDPLQSQYLLNRLVINPAFAGADGYLSATASYRRQWLGFSGAPETYAFTLCTPLRNKHYNIGLIASQDNIAVMHRTRAGLVYAYRIYAGKISFAAGFQPSVVFVKNSWENVQAGNPGDASFSHAETGMNFEMGYGLYMQSKRFYFGVSSVAKFSEKVNPVRGDQPIVLATTGYTFGDRQKTAVTIALLGRYMLNSFYTADASLLVTLRDRITVGGSYRYKDAAVGILELKINDQFHLGYSYDYTLSHLSNYSSGTHEIILRYDFAYKVNTQSPRLPAQ